MRPRIICHMLATVDGKIDGAALHSVSGGGEYAETSAAPGWEEQFADRRCATRAQVRRAAWRRRAVGSLRRDSPLTPTGDDGADAQAGEGRFGGVGRGPGLHGAELRVRPG